MNYKIGDLVQWHDIIYIVVRIDPNFVTVMNIQDGQHTSAFPPDWLTKVETDKFCPLHSSTNPL